MNKKVFVAVIAVVTVCVLSFFTAEKQYTPAANEIYFSFTDSEENVVVLKEKPKRVAVLFSSHAEVWKNAGGELTVTVGETIERGICTEDVLLVDGGAGKVIDNELLISYEPDFVICSADVQSHKETANLMKKADIPVALVRIESFEDYLSALEIFTKITGQSENYEKYGTDVKKEISTILKGSQGRNEKKILFIRSGSSSSSAKAKKAEEHFAAKMLEESGCCNIADEAEFLLDGLSIEEIIKQNPEHIFISIMGDEQAGKAYMNEVISSDSWQTLTAVKEGKIHFLPKDLFQYKPCARWAEAYKYLDNILGE